MTPSCYIGLLIRGFVHLIATVEQDVRHDPTGHSRDWLIDWYQIKTKHLWYLSLHCVEIERILSWINLLGCIIRQRCRLYWQSGYAWASKHHLLSGISRIKCPCNMPIIAFNDQLSVFFIEIIAWNHCMKSLLKCVANWFQSHLNHRPITSPSWETTPFPRLSVIYLFFKMFFNVNLGFAHPPPTTFVYIPPISHS